MAANQTYLDLLDKLREAHEADGAKGDPLAQFVPPIVRIPPHTAAYMLLWLQAKQLAQALEAADKPVVGDAVESGAFVLAQCALALICLRREQAEAKTGRAARTRKAIEQNAELDAKINQEFEPTVGDGLDEYTDIETMPAPLPARPVKEPPLEPPGLCPECNMPKGYGHADTCEIGKRERRAAREN